MTGLGSGLLGLLDRRFTATVWLPTLVLWSALAALAAAGPGWHRSVTWWTSQPVQVQLLLTVLALAWITFTASLTAGHLLGLLRLAEGYWPERGPLGRWRERRRKHYRDAVGATLKGPGTPGALPAGALGTDVPARLDRVMPTRLGNVLRAAEDHAEERYGIATVVVWPRLYLVLPPTYVAALGAAKSSLDLMATVLVHSVVFAVAGTVLASALLPWPVAMACLLGGVLLAWQAYEGAVHAARPYADLVRSAFDVYRPLLLDQLRLERASSWPAERRQWAQLSHLWAQGAPEGPEGARLLGYPAPPAAPPAPRTGGGLTSGPASIRRHRKRRLR